MEGERERLNQRISALTEQIADAKCAETFSVRFFSSLLKSRQTFLSSQMQSKAFVKT